MDKNTLVSVCSVLHNCEFCVELFLEDVSSVLRNHFEYYEIVLIDNGSNDRTVSLIQNLLKIYPKVRFLPLVREYDERTAQTAALENAIGDFIILMDVNSDPPSLIPQMVKKTQNGCDIVTVEYTARPNEPLYFRFFRWIFYSLSNALIEFKVKPSWSNYVCFSRKILNYILQVRTHIHYLKYLNTEIGHAHQTLPAEPINRSPRYLNRYRFWNSFFFAFDTLLSNSERVLRLATSLSLGMSFLSFTYFLYTIAINIFKNHVAEGWTSTSIVLSVMFTVLFFILFIIGEFVFLIHKEIKKGPGYHAVNEFNSSMQLSPEGNTQQKNVVESE